MKLGVMASGLGPLGWAGALAYCQKLGLDAFELPLGPYPGKPFFDPAELLASEPARTQLRDDLARHGLVLSAIAVHGNPVHPDADLAAEHERDHDRAVQLAPLLGTDVVISFSGCPGGSAADRTPNWITSAWPDDYQVAQRYQWDDVLAPFWARKNREAADAGVRLALEPHPGMAVYNAETMLRLREVAGDHVGVNLDPSHLFWQGADVVEATRVLGEAGAIFHVHGKDTAIDPRNAGRHGTLDAKHYGRLAERCWTFRTCGYGHGDEFWKPFVSMLRLQGYDGVISIEHEDPYMSMQEGFEKAVRYLQRVLIRAPADETWNR